MEKKLDNALTGKDSTIFTALTPETAHQEAMSASLRREKGMPLSAIDGSLVVIKGNIEIEGLACHVGSQSLQIDVAKQDAPLVKQLRNAGAVILGHANMSEFAFSGLGINPHFGTPPNPLSKVEELVPGGSSSGCASAVSLGLADMAIGSDTSGSVRVPAAFQGLVGFRPSRGRYDGRGVFPLAPSLDVPGTIARTVGDIIELDSVLSKQEYSSQVELSEKTFVVPCLNKAISLDEEVSSEFERSIEHFKRSGLNVIHRPVKTLLKVIKLFEKYGTLVSYEAQKTILSRINLEDDPIDSHVYFRLKSALGMSDKDGSFLQKYKTELEKEIGDELKDALLLLPTTPNLPPTVKSVHNQLRFSEANARTLYYTMLSAFLNLPSIALPTIPKTLGASLSVSGKQNSDSAVLAVAKGLETLLTAREKIS